MIYSAELKVHKEHLRLVLTKLRENRLFLNPAKCPFAVAEVEFLGHLVGGGRVLMDPAKVKAIAEWAVPWTPMELQSFLGVSNFYRRFIAGYSKIAAPLSDLLRKIETWRWGAEQQEAFRGLRTWLSLTSGAPSRCTPMRPTELLEESSSRWSIR